MSHGNLKHWKVKGSIGLIFGEYRTTQTILVDPGTLAILLHFLFSGARQLRGLKDSEAVAPWRTLPCYHWALQARRRRSCSFWRWPCKAQDGPDSISVKPWNFPETVEKANSLGCCIYMFIIHYTHISNIELYHHIEPVVYWFMCIYIHIYI